MVVPSLPFVDDLVVNEVEAANITGEPLRDGDGDLMADAMVTAARRLLDAGVRKTAVIHAPEGSVALTVDGAVVSQPGHDIATDEIRCSAGAGDAFASGVAYGLSNGWALPDTLRLATAMAALSLFDPTTTGGARPLDEVVDFSMRRPYREGVFDNA